MPKQSYADQKNAQYNSSDSHLVSLQERWNDTCNGLNQFHRDAVDYALESARNEFRRRNPEFQKFSDLPLAQSVTVPMTSIVIDTTMQRELDINWVLKLINQFCPIMVMPIQVYYNTEDRDKAVGWDGQHTAVMLWLIAVFIFGEDPSKLQVPVNIYKSNQKARMRANFISLNSSEGKNSLEAIDLWRQWIFGVRIDGSNNPVWKEAEGKQRHIEKAGLFVTAKKYGDEREPGAITRLQEINKLDVATVEQLCQYLVHSTKLSRPVEEKEIVMMSHFLDRCRIEGISVDKSYIADIANCAERHWQSDFSPNGAFWTKAGIAYYNWHRKLYGDDISARFSKEPVHGLPFLLAQFKKDLNLKLPQAVRSEFVPLDKDLF